MPDEIQHRLSTEGADPLLLAGVNDANLLALEKALGVKVLIRGDAITLGGSYEQVEILREGRLVNCVNCAWLTPQRGWTPGQ